MRANSECTVRTGAGQHDAHCVFAAVCSKGAEEAIDWRSLATRFNQCSHSQGAILDRQCRIRGDDVYTVRKDLRVVTDLRHGHLCVPSQQIRQSARMIRGKVLDDDKPDIGIGCHVLEVLSLGYVPDRGGISTERLLGVRTSGRSETDHGRP